ncbi:type VII secretion protein EccB [Phytomonospora endophytica]|uniref:Type VII secretion protein EccB n=1 Tax=Phytomonospora endophytica TaxID=714109 RepID=A0A841FH36_9ACTN|nr:type VII secretion protein EccB [Phytomonospora endophytica]MBB6032872.1 type VII secretion protein EccB [Phytomonospora endophytica]GIG65098.1 type VII secretion protein EccB [Phytomonospora endophytica]
MRTRREQVQAQRFVIRRIVSAMLSANPESLELPMRRMGLSILGGAMAAVLIAVGFFVVGFLFPGGATAWKENGTIVIEQETGATYVYNQGTLVPMLNFASARLFVESDAPKVMTIRQKSLENTPRGNPMGIVGAPESVPDKKFLLTMPWQVCSAVSPAAENRLATRVILGAATDPASDLAGRAVLLTTAGQYYLLWNDRLYQVPEQDRTLPAIGMSTADAVEVTPLLLNAIETGPVLSIPIADAGRPARELGGEPRVNGDVFKVETRFYVLDAAGLHLIGELAAKILGWTEGGPQLSAADVTANQSATPVEPERFPQTVPQLAPIDRDQSIAVCGAHSGQATANGTAFSAQVHSPVTGTLTEGVPPTVAGTDPTKTAEYVWQPGGTGVLARAIAADGNTGGTVYLVTNGVKYALTPDAVTRLGFGGSEPQPVFESYLALVPSGPALTALPVI